MSRQSQFRIELHALAVTTPTDAQILAGDRGDRAATIGCELRLPVSAAPLPAIVLLHGADGPGASADRWARLFVERGYAVLLLDCFTGRGMAASVSDPAPLSPLVLLLDAYRALDLLAAHRAIDRRRIAVQGVSAGAAASLYAANRRFRQAFGAPGYRFVAHVGLSALCNVAYRDDEQTTSVPIRLFHGTADDVAPIGPCRSYVERMRAAGADVSLVELKGAHHGFDDVGVDGVRRVADAVTVRGSALQEQPDGTLSGTQPVERGAHFAYSPGAHMATLAALDAFYTELFERLES